MPKVRGPLFSLKAAGTLGKAITYKKGTAGNIVRKYYKPKGTRNAEQSTVRTWFQRGVWTWQGNAEYHGYAFSRHGYGLEEVARAEWRPYRTTGGSFGYYAFMKRWIKRSLLGLPQYQVPPHFGFCVADEWLANFLYANGKFHDWVSALPPVPAPTDSQYVEGIIGLWHFDIDEDPVTDSSGEGHPGDLQSTGHPVFTSDGKFGGAYNYPASQDYINYGINTLDDYPVATFMFWLNPNSLAAAYQGVFCCNGGSDNDNYQFLVRSTGQMYVMIRTTGGGYKTIEAAGPVGGITADNWSLVIITYDGSTMRVYVNGNSPDSVGGLSGNIENFAVPAYTGCERPGYRPFNGKIDELAIIDRAITDQEASDIYTNNLPLRTTP